MDNTKYKEERTRSIETILKNAISFLDQEQVKQELLRKVVNSYSPSKAEVTDRVMAMLKDTLEREIVKQSELIVEQIVTEKYYEKVEEMVQTALNRRLRGLLNEEYD